MWNLHLHLHVWCLWMTLMYGGLPVTCYLVGPSILHVVISAHFYGFVQWKEDSTFSALHCFQTTQRKVVVKSQTEIWYLCPGAKTWHCTETNSGWR